MSDQVSAAVALSRIDGHEKVCSERYAEIKESFGRVHGRIDWILYTAIGSLLASCGGLLFLVFGHGK
jgi:hypothetical protein